MKNNIIVLFAALFAANIVTFAQGVDSLEYRRSSIYSLMINHSKLKFAKEIGDAFVKMPVPDKYNDHNLSVKIVTSDDEKHLSDNTRITEFLDRNYVASRLVGRWFNRNIFNGQCDMELVKSRGLYNASEFDKELARQSTRGIAMLEDAGEDLINNTFVLANDIRYIDKAKGSKTAGGFLKVLGAVAAAYTGNDFLEDLGNTAGSLTETYKGFSVKIKSYLYQLVWDEAVVADFYRNGYASKPDSVKKAYFDSHRSSFKLKYVGMQESSGSNTSFLGINEEQPQKMVRKACQRALDENVANLQKNFEQFKVRVPLTKIEPLQAQIGMKEGISEASRFEVLEVQKDEKGKTTYKRVGVISPVSGEIWDNRYMAVEEGAVGAKLGATTFKKVSGKDFYPGMLIREIK